MNRLSSGLVKKITHRVVEGQDVEQISNDLSVELENVLLIYYGLHESVPEKEKPFDDNYSDFIRECIKYGVETERLAKVLGIESKKEDPKPGSNGHSINGLLYENDLINRRGSPFAHDPNALESNRITSFGNISGDYREFDRFLSLFRKRDYSTILKANNKTVGSSAERDASAVLFHLASKISTSVDLYMKEIECNQGLANYLKSPLYEMKSKAQDFLADVASSLGRSD